MRPSAILNIWLIYDRQACPAKSFFFLGGRVYDLHSRTSAIYASLPMTPVSQGLVFVRAHVCALWVHPLRLVCVLEPQRGAPSNPGSTLVHRRTRVPLSPTNRWGVNTDQDGVQLADARVKTSLHLGDARAQYTTATSAKRRVDLWN